MLSTNRNVIQEVQSLYSKGVQSQNSRLSNRHIYSKLIRTRSQVLSQEAKKKQALSQWTYQTLACIELIEVPYNECPCTLQSGCMVLRTKYPIPSIIYNADCPIIQSVTGLEGRISFKETTFKDRKYSKGNKYTSNRPEFFIRDFEGKDYIYITVTLRLETITLTAIFDNPIFVYLFPAMCGSIDYSCLNYLDFEFHCDRDLMNSIIALTAEELIGDFSKRQQDITNNSIDDAIQDKG